MKESPDLAISQAFSHLRLMDQITTLAIIGICIALGVLCGWRGAQPPNVMKGPRLVPYNFLMLVCVAVGLMMLVHLANLNGVVTGNVAVR
jgi:hypothetical protein